MNTFLFYSIQFIVGGASVVGMTLIAKYIDPKFSGIAYAFPIIIMVSMIFLYFGSGKEIAVKSMRSTAFYEATLIYFVICFYVLLQRMNFWSAMGISLVSWMVIAGVVQIFLK